MLRSSRLLLCLPLAAMLSGCETLGSLNPWNGDKTTLADKQKADPGSIPVETLYNNGVDALNAKRYRAAATQFDSVEQNYPYSSWAVNAQLMHGYSEYLQNHYTRRDRRAGPVHPAAPDAPRRRLRLLSAGAVLLRADRRHPARPEGHAAGDERAAGRGQPLPRQRLCPRRPAEDRPVPRPPGRQGDGDRPLVREASTSTPPRSAASSGWSTTTRPPTTCRKRCTG